MVNSKRRIIMWKDTIPSRDFDFEVIMMDKMWGFCDEKGWTYPGMELIKYYITDLSALEHDEDVE
jgi:hypothetical protein